MVPPKQLEQWAQRCLSVDAWLLRVSGRLQIRGDIQTSQAVLQARRLNNQLMADIKRIGSSGKAAADPIAEPEIPETALHLLGSDAARRFSIAMREAADACREMEAERGVENGLTEQLEALAETAELEAFGPIGLGLE